MPSLIRHHSCESCAMYHFTMPDDAQLPHFPPHPATAIAQLLALKTIIFDNHSHMALPDASFHFSWRPGQSWIFESNGLAHCTGQSSLNADIKTAYQSMPPSRGCLRCIEITKTNEMVALILVLWRICRTTPKLAMAAVAGALPPSRSVGSATANAQRPLGPFVGSASAFGQPIVTTTCHYCHGHLVKLP